MPTFISKESSILPLLKIIYSLRSYTPQKIFLSLVTFVYVNPWLYLGGMGERRWCDLFIRLLVEVFFFFFFQANSKNIQTLLKFWYKKPKFWITLKLPRRQMNLQPFFLTSREVTWRQCELSNKQWTNNGNKIVRNIFPHTLYEEW